MEKVRGKCEKGGWSEDVPAYVSKAELKPPISRDFFASGGD